MDQGASLAELVRMALLNIDQYDKIAREDEPDAEIKKGIDLRTHRQKFDDGLALIAARQGWGTVQLAQVGGLKKRRPPDRLYRIRGGYHSATRGLDALGIILSYRPGTRGGPPEAGVMVLGFSSEMVGSAAHPLGVPEEALEDVTDSARSGKLGGLV